MTIRHPSKRHAGNAYIEALVVTSLFTLLFLCALSFGRTYSAKLLSTRLAREAAWARTHVPCGNTEYAVLEAAHAVISAPDAASSQRLAAAAFAKKNQTERTASVGRWQGWLRTSQGSHVVSVETATRFVCNEMPPPSAASAGDTRQLGALMGEVTR